MLFKFLPFLTTFPPVITTHSFFTALTFRPFRALCKSAGHWAFSDEMLLSITSPEWIVKHRNVTNCVLGGDSCGDSTCCVRNLPLRAPPSADWSQLIYYWHPNWKNCHQIYSSVCDDGNLTRTNTHLVWCPPGEHLAFFTFPSKVWQWRQLSV